MTIYRLRSKDGEMKAILPASIAINVIAYVRGEWRTANYPSGEIQQYVLGSDMSMDMTRGGETLTVFFWKGDKIDLG